MMILWILLWIGTGITGVYWLAKHDRLNIYLTTFVGLTILAVVCGPIVLIECFICYIIEWLYKWLYNRKNLNPLLWTFK